MNESFEILCKKYDLAEEVQTEFLNFFEKEIVKVFYKKSEELTVKSTKSTKKSTKSVEKETSSEDLCKGKKSNGDHCTFKGKENGYCGRHNPDKSSKTSKSKSPEIKKKVGKNECHAIIIKTGKQCVQPGTEVPGSSKYHYCKRHSAKWMDFEKDSEIVIEDKEEEKEDEDEESLIEE